MESVRSSFDEQPSGSRSSKFISAVKAKVNDSSFRVTCLVAFVYLLTLGICTGIPLGMYAKRPATKVYYIQADLVLWDYTPKATADGQGINMCTGNPYTESEQVYTRSYIGTKYYKAVWRQYTGPDYKYRVPRAPEWQHLGYLGPLLDLEVGDVVEVHVRNDVLMDVSFDVQGLERLPGSAEVTRLLTTGQTATYKYLVRDEAGPAHGSDVQTKLWLYRSTLLPKAGDYGGLVGPVLVRRPGTTPPRQFISVLMVSNENNSPLIYQSLGLSTQTVSSLADPDFVESNVMHGINGYLYCDGPAYRMRQGEDVYWHVAGLGNTVDIHTAHWHGNTGTIDGRRDDEILLIPGTTNAIKMHMSNPGRWLMHCHINDHFASGMSFIYEVWGPGETMAKLPAVPAQIPTADLAVPEPGGRVREYWVAAEEGVWDYTPVGEDACVSTGRRKLLDWAASQLTYTGTTPVDGVPRIGSSFIKARFVEYTANFSAVKPRLPEDGYLGILGPIFRAEVGDVIKVHLRNSLLQNATTMHPHGVFYNKASEGAMYNDGTPADERGDDMIEPGVTYTFNWAVPDSSGPGVNDGSSLLWMYHGHTMDEQYAGLLGGIIITRRGMADKETAKPLDVDREFVLHYGVMNEMNSYLADRNYATYIPGWTNKTADEQAAILEDAGFAESLAKHSINGYQYCNAPPMPVTQGNRVRFHLLSTGTEVDLHSPRLQATTMDSDGVAAGTTMILPGMIHTVDSQITSAGDLVFTCGVHDHITAGMQALVQVTPNPAFNNSLMAAGGQTRRYFIQAEKVEWAYAPRGQACPNPFTEATVDPNANIDKIIEVESRRKRSLLQSGDKIAAPTEVSSAELSDSLWEIFGLTSASTIGSKYKKFVYVQYTDASFTTKVAQPGWNGILGPTIRSEVGDTVEIVLRNAIDASDSALTITDVNLEVYGGVKPLVASGEALYTRVPAGQTRTLRFYVPEEAGPKEMDLSTVAYIYQSTVSEVVQTNEGLFGTWVVGKKGALQASGTPYGVDYDVPLMFAVLNENWSELLAESRADAGIEEPESAVLYDLGNRKFTVNGYVFCNLQVNVSTHSLVRFYTMSVGSENGFHSPRFSNLPVVSSNWAFYAADLLPSTVRTVDLYAQAEGAHTVVSTVTDSYSYGMRALVNVGNFFRGSAGGSIRDWAAPFRG